MSQFTSIKAHLTKCHGDTANDLTITIWSRFSGAVLEAISKAGSILTEGERIRPYQARTGWWRSARQKNGKGIIVSIPSEDAITDALVETLEGMRASALPGDPLYDLNIAFASQQPRQVQTRAGAKSLTTDLRAFVPGNPSLDFRVEAKVLCKGNDLIKGYLGAEGLMRFADAANPYTTGMVGGMVGYTVNAQDPCWEHRLVTGLADHASTTNVATVAITAPPPAFAACDVNSSNTGRRVTIFHVMLPFETDPPC